MGDVPALGYATSLQKAIVRVTHHTNIHSIKLFMYYSICNLCSGISLK